MATVEDAQEIAGWRYDDDVAAPDLEAMLDRGNDYHSALGSEGELIGWCCFGPDARVPGVGEEPAVLDVAYGLRPDLIGIGLAGPFVRAVCELGRERHRPQAFRLVVGAFNQRSQRVAAALGFERTGVHSTERGDFVLMARVA